MVDITRSRNMNSSAVGALLKSKDKVVECVEVCCAEDVGQNIAEAWESDGGDGEPSQHVAAGPAPAPSPTQLNADLRELKVYMKT